MLAFCAQHGITADIELLPSARVNEALDRLGRGDVRHRFVLDLSDLDLSGPGLSDLDLLDSDPSGSDLSGSDLSGSDPSGSDLVGPDPSGSGRLGRRSRTAG